eukprot:m.155802 g.155802  ORF g.155802 m.155802 type:complete len:383 (+) comp52917_c0_seq2:1131-2279(+)
MGDAPVEMAEEAQVRTPEEACHQKGLLVGWGCSGCTRGVSGARADRTQRAVLIGSFLFGDVEMAVLLLLALAYVAMAEEQVGVLTSISVSPPTCIGDCWWPCVNQLSVTTKKNSTIYILEIDGGELTYQSGDCVFASCPSRSCIIDITLQNGTCSEGDTADAMTISRTNSDITIVWTSHDGCIARYEAQTGTVADLDAPDLYCFPSDATVQLEDGSLKQMQDIEIGDRVLATTNTFSEVFMFTHRDALAQVPFVRISTEHGHVLRLTGNHYLYINGSLAAAQSARVGDTVLDHNGKTVVISGVSMERGSGLFNPHTLHGEIVVNGIQTSTYTTALAPTLAHAVLWPARLLYTLGHNLLDEEFFAQNSNLLAALGPRGRTAYP